MRVQLSGSYRRLEIIVGIVESFMICVAKYSGDQFKEDEMGLLGERRDA